MLHYLAMLSCKLPTSNISDFSKERIVCLKKKNLSTHVIRQWKYLQSETTTDNRQCTYVSVSFMTLQQVVKIIIKQRHNFGILIFTTVKLGYNDHGYNEYTVITNRII